MRRTLQQIKTLLMRRLINLKLKKGESSVKHFNGFQVIVNQLAIMNYKVDDKIQTLILMSLLTKSWKTLVVVLNNSNSDRVVSI